MLSRLGPSIHDALISDFAISNPGHSGFSLKETDLWTGQEEDENKKKVTEFLQKAVSWAILEERPHVSKKREGVSRRKWYLHPLFSPVFAIPYIRAKEPFYVDIIDVYNWIYVGEAIKFSRSRTLSKPRDDYFPQQLRIPFKELK